MTGVPPNVTVVDERKFDPEMKSENAGAPAFTLGGDSAVSVGAGLFTTTGGGGGGGGGGAVIVNETASVETAPDCSLRQGAVVVEEAP